MGDTFYIDTHTLIDENNVEVDPKKIDDGSLRISVAVVPKQLRYERDEFIRKLYNRAGRDITRELIEAGLIDDQV